MSNTKITKYGNAKAEWLDKEQNWVVRLYPNTIADRRPLYKAVTKQLHEHGWSTSILQQRNNKLLLTCWKPIQAEAVKVIPLGAEK
jgi:hypothetical protein